MSDGPHRSLPMRPPWKRVAHWADKEAFSVEDVRASVEVATEQDCREQHYVQGGDTRTTYTRTPQEGSAVSRPNLVPRDEPGRMILCPNCGRVVDPYGAIGYSGHTVIDTTQHGERPSYIVGRCPEPPRRA